MCGGAQIHVIDRNAFKPFLTGVMMVGLAYNMYPDDFRWKQSPYEYVFDKNPFDVINGGETIRNLIEQNAARGEIEQVLAKDEDAFRELRRGFMLY